MPKEPLTNVIAAGGDWGSCSEAVAELLQCGNLGKVLFSFAGLHTNAVQFSKAIEGYLAKLVQDGVTGDNIEAFKVAAAAKTEEFQAQRSI